VRTSQELRDEAKATDDVADLVSYAPDRQWLKDKAEALRHEADRQEQCARRSLKTPPDLTEGK
jgi:hypothetical protein